MKNNKGITLVALVVTIIVLLILAAVSINLVLGENGIITRARDARRNQEIANIVEEIKLDLITEEMDEEKSITQVQIEDVLIKYGTINKDGDGNIESFTPTDKNYDIPFDEIWDGTIVKPFDRVKNVNRPELGSGMTPIKFIEATSTADGKAVNTTITDENWYDYESQKWANVKTKDGSMWVWIPRFAYKINTSTQTTDVVFLIGRTDDYYEEDGSIGTAQRQTDVDQIMDTTIYTVHPAFTNESAINYANGGWDKELTGIWVAKFEAGYASGGNKAPIKATNINYTHSTVWSHAIETETGVQDHIAARNWLDGIYGTTITPIKYPVFQGSTYSMNYIDHNEVYLLSKSLTDSGNIYGLNKKNTDSHLMKNSEWGAVAYLSKSEYGLGSIDIAVNKKNLMSGESSLTKEEGNKLASVYAVTGYNQNDNKWNEYIGTNLSASTTGNMYGIYDFAGGLWECVSAIISNGNQCLYIKGKSLIDEAKMEYTVNESTGEATVNRDTGVSTKYVTIYPNNDLGETNSSTARQKNYESNTKIYGDAVRETSTEGNNYTGWYDDQSKYPALKDPFFKRGNSMTYDSKAGLFSFDNSSSGNAYNLGFRAVLIVR